MPVDPVTLGVIGASAVANTAGSIYASNQNRASAREQMRFQERMSNTSHQREMADLRKANLNPLLTGKYGGASTPQGAQYKTENPMAGMMQLASSAIDIAKINQQEKLIKAQANKLEVDASATEAKLPVEIDKLLNEIENISATTGKTLVEKEKIKEEIKNLKAIYAKVKVKSRIWDAIDRLSPEGKQIADDIKRIEAKPISDNPVVKKIISGIKWLLKPKSLRTE